MQPTYNKYDVMFRALPDQSGPFRWYTGGRTVYANSVQDAELQTLALCRDWYGVEFEILSVKQVEFNSSYLPTPISA